MRIILITTISFLLVFSSCQNIKEQKKENQKEASLKTPNNDKLKVNDSSYLSKKPLKNISLPIGDSLLLHDFPEKWEISKQNKNEKILDAISKSQERFIANMVNTTESSKDTLSHKRIKYLEYYNNYLSYLFSFNKNNEFEKTKNIYSILEKKKYDVVIATSTEKFTSTRVYIYTINKQNEIIDGINISYNIGRDLYSNVRYFYIDSNLIIHLKSFTFIDDETILESNEKHQINTNGKIIRYFSDNQKYITKKHNGTTANNTQVGYWTEIQSNYFVDDITFSDGKYLDGLKIGTWNYFNLENSKKGSNLLMTEEYSNDGELLKREILKKQ